MEIGMDKKSWIRVIAVEAAIMVALMLLAAFPRVNNKYNAEELIRLSEESFKTPAMKLGYGSYKYTIEYETNSENCFAFLDRQSISEEGKQLIGRMEMDAVKFLPDRQSISTEAFIFMGAKDYSVYTFRFSDSELTIKSISVVKTMGGVFRIGIMTALVSAIVDLIMLFADRKKRGLVKEGSVEVFFILAATVLFTSVPLFFNYLINGHDLQFHLIRIEGIKNGILSGDFPIKIQSNWLNGNGYAVGVFYGDLFLYIPALLRLCGFGVRQSYNIYVFLCNIATCAIAYYSFKGMTGKRKPAVVGSVLYTTSLYRLLDMYVRSSVGEYSAMTFLPLLAYGLWKVFYDDTDTAAFKRNWILPVLGFTGIINTHILTCEMAGAFTILLCLILFKRTFQKKRFIVLLKIVIYTCIINIGFLVPFLHYMHLGGFVLTAYPPKYIQQYGAFIGQMLDPVVTFEGLTVGLEEGIAGELPLTTGLGLIMGGAALAYSFCVGYIKDKKEKTSGIIFGVFTVISIWLSSYLFPWDLLQNICYMMKKVVSTLQFPWRFLSIAGVMLAVCAVTALKNIDEKKKVYKYIAIGMISVSVIQAGQLMGNIMNSYTPYIINAETSLDTTEVVGAEYLPAGQLVEAFEWQYAKPDENISYVENYRKNNYIECSVANNSDMAGNVKLSICYYEGYTAVDEATGERLEVFNDEGSLCMKVEPGYSGNIVVKFTGFTAWRIAAVISILASVAFIVYIVDKNGVIVEKLHIRREKK